MNSPRGISPELDAEDEDEPSSTQQNEKVLADFREKWQKELHISSERQVPKTTDKSTTDLNEKEEHDSEDRAKLLFLKGIELERAGKLYEAIQFYRRAVQIIPDIEFRVEQGSKRNLRVRKYSEEENAVNNNHDNNVLSDESDDEILPGELLNRIHKKLLKSSDTNILFPEVEPKTTHISALPVEIILYILRWLVSADLDLRSLEVCARVCRGLYLCARDEKIWRLACLRVWGRHCGNSSAYSSWRQMYIERPRLLFNGCYISKTTYIRPGENSFQDQFYKPWHLIAYYRFFRFFPEGLVLVLTSSDDPAQSVGHLKYRNARPPVLLGYYRLKDDRVILVVQKQENKGSPGIKWNKKDTIRDSAEQTFHMEFQIKNQNKRKNVKLEWLHYSVFTRTKRGDESTCNFDLVTNRFPPLWFSRVKSFTSESEVILQ